jgi:predicted hotdog family 3-hydroxylacyl-ACP dehydratase
MLLIDELLEADEEHAIARISLHDRSSFLVDGGVPAVVMIEYMAQCIGALVGFDDLQHGRDVKIGFLMACRQATFFVDQVHPGDELLVHARLKWGGDGMGLFDCSVERAGQTIARATLSVFRGKLDDQEVS